jgi:hypothetical protein
MLKAAKQNKSKLSMTTTCEQLWSETDMHTIRSIPDPSDQPMTPTQIPTRCIQEHSEERVLPYEFVGNTRMLLIGASMGSGKTHQVHEYLASHLDIGRVLIITADEQQAAATCNALAGLQWDDGSRGFTRSFDHLDDYVPPPPKPKPERMEDWECIMKLGYVPEERPIRRSKTSPPPDDVQGPMEYPSCRMGRFDKLVVNYNSLHEMIVGAKITVYDLVIIDDIRNVLSAAMACEKFSSELNLDHDILQSLTGGRYSICLGANIEMDGAVWGWVSEVVCDEEIQFHRYTHVANRRELLVVHTSQWERMLCASLARGQRVGVPCRSKTAMHGVLGLDEVVLHNTLHFDADSDPDKLQTMQNIDKNLDGVDVLAFTDKTATAVDIQETFHTVYAHCDAVAEPTPRDMLQMIGRFRHVTSGRVVCCLPGVLDPAPSVTFWSENGVISRFEDVGVKLKSCLGFGRTTYGDNGLIRMKQHALIGLASHGRVERNGCFTTSFVQQALRKGWRVTVCVTGDDALADEMKQLLVDDTPNVVTHAGKMDPVGSIDEHEPQESVCRPSRPPLYHQASDV